MRVNRVGPNGVSRNLNVSKAPLKGKVEVRESQEEARKLSPEERRQLEKELELVRKYVYPEYKHAEIDEEGTAWFYEKDGKKAWGISAEEVHDLYEQLQKRLPEYKSAKRKYWLKKVLKGGLSAAAGVVAGLGVAGMAASLGLFAPVVAGVLTGTAGVIHAWRSANNADFSTNTFGVSDEAQIFNAIAGGLARAGALIGGSVALGGGGALAGALLTAVNPALGLGVGTGLAVKEATNALLDKLVPSRKPVL